MQKTLPIPQLAGTGGKCAACVFLSESLGQAFRESHAGFEPETFRSSAEIGIGEGLSWLRELMAQLDPVSPQIIIPREDQKTDEPGVRDRWSRMGGIGLPVRGRRSRRPYVDLGAESRPGSARRLGRAGAHQH